MGNCTIHTSVILVRINSNQFDMADSVGPPPFTPPSSPTKSNDSVFTSSLVTSGRAGGRTFLIGVAGGTASGKTTVCKKIMEQLEQQDSSHKRVLMLSQDSFYKKLEPKDKKLANKGEYNFDHPGR